MKSTLSTKVGVAIALVAFLGLPLFAQAQYGPPSGYEGMTPPSGDTMGPPSGTMGGPPADVQAKMDAALARLKKNTAGMTRAVSAMDKAIKGVQDAGFTVPADILASVESGRAAIQTILNSTSLDENCQNAIDQFTTFTETIEANMENLMVLSKFPAILKPAQTNYDKVVKFFATTQSKLTGLEMDLTGVFAKVQEKIDGLKASMDKANELAKSGKAQEAFDELQNVFFSNLEDAYQSIGMLNALKGIGKATSAVANGIKTAGKIITKLKGLKIDTTKLEDFVAQSTAKLNELKTLIATPGYDVDKAQALLDELDTLRSNFDDTTDQLVEDSGKNVGNLPVLKMFSGTMPMVPATIKGGYDKYKNKMGTQVDRMNLVPTGGFGMPDTSGTGAGTGGMQIPEGYGPPGGIPAGYGF
jgi:hypothetical protein